MIQPFRRRRKEKSSLSHNSKPVCRYFPFSVFEIPGRRIKFPEELSCQPLGGLKLFHVKNLSSNQIRAFSIFNANCEKKKKCNFCPIYSGNIFSIVMPEKCFQISSIIQNWVFNYGWCLLRRVFYTYVTNVEDMGSGICVKTRHVCIKIGGKALGDTGW